MAMSHVIEIRSVMLSNIFPCYEYDYACVGMWVRFFLPCLITCTSNVTCKASS